MGAGGREFESRHSDHKKSPAASRRAFLLSDLPRLTADVGENAAVGVQDLTVHEVGGVGGQEDAGADHIFRVAPAARRGLGGDELVEGVTAAVGLDLTQRGGLGGGDIARTHAVALDVVLAVLGGDVLGQHLEGALCGGVGGDGLAAQLAHHGADVDDLSLLLFHHVGQDSLGAVERTAHMDVDDPHEVGVAHLDHRHPLHQAGIVDQNVHRADLGLDLRHHRVDGVLVGDVCGIAVSVNAGGFISGHALLKAGLGRAVEADGGTALGHTLCDGEADAVRTAGDEGDPALQIESR